MSTELPQYTVIKIPDALVQRLGCQSPRDLVAKLEGMAGPDTSSENRTHTSTVKAQPVTGSARTIWDSDADIRAEFETFECFERYHRNAVAGYVRDEQFAPVTTGTDTPNAQSLWDTDPSLREEFAGNFAAFKLFHEASREGRVHGIKR